MLRNQSADFCYFVVYEDGEEVNRIDMLVYDTIDEFHSVLAGEGFERKDAEL